MSCEGILFLAMDTMREQKMHCPLLSVSRLAEAQVLFLYALTQSDARVLSRTQAVNMRHGSSLQ
jgi:hypothetical protein